MEREDYARMYELEDSYWWFVGKRCIADVLLRTVATTGADRLALDVGCGTGGTLQHLLSRYGRGVGLDISATALGYCLQRGLDRLCQGSAPHLPFADGSFDLLTALDLLYHEWIDDDREALRECARVLRPGGWLLVTDSALPILWSKHDVRYHARRRYTRGRLQSSMEAAGFVVRKLSYVNAILFPIAMAFRTWSRLSGSVSADDLLLRPLPGWLNGLLTGIYTLEARGLRWLDYPAGVSVVCLAQKP